MRNLYLSSILSRRLISGVGSRANVLKLFMLPVCLVLLSALACEQPCAGLARKVCNTSRPESEECLEVKTFADRAGITERNYCQTALSVIESFGNGE